MHGETSKFCRIISKLRYQVVKRLGIIDHNGVAPLNALALYKSRFLSDTSGRRWACLYHIVKYIWEKGYQLPTP